MSPARLRAIADTLPGYVCGRLQALADAWERDLADVERFRKLARGYMDERDEAQNLLVEVRPLCDATGSDDLVAFDAPLGRQIDAHLAAHHGYPTAQEAEDLQRVYDEATNDPKAAPSGHR